MAIDDISFTPKCRFVEEPPPPTTTTPTTPKPCPDGKFTCSDGSCIEQVQISRKLELKLTSSQVLKIDNTLL